MTAGPVVAPTLPSVHDLVRDAVAAGLERAPARGGRLDVYGGLVAGPAGTRAAVGTEILHGLGPRGALFGRAGASTDGATWAAEVLAGARLVW